MQLDSIKTRVESARGFSSWDYNDINCFQRLLSVSTWAPTSRGMLEKLWAMEHLPHMRGRAKGLTLVHFSAQRKRFLWDRDCI